MSAVPPMTFPHIISYVSWSSNSFFVAVATAGQSATDSFVSSLGGSAIDSASSKAETTGVEAGGAGLCRGGDDVPSIGPSIVGVSSEVLTGGKEMVWKMKRASLGSPLVGAPV